MKRINTIRIQNVKGIQDRTLHIDLVPNKPAILVASNGFGKSSIAVALDSLIKTRIDLKKTHFHKGEEANKPVISLTYTDDSGAKRNIAATHNSNDISKILDIYIINSRLEPKAIQRRINGVNTVSPQLTISPIVLIDSIPESCSLPYSPSLVKNEFGLNGKILPNVANDLSNNTLLCELDKEIDFSRFTQTKTKRKIENCISSINLQTGNSSTILDYIYTHHIETLKQITILNKLVSILVAYGEKRDNDTQYYLAAISIFSIIIKDIQKYKNTVKHCKCEEEQKEYSDCITALTQTWKDIRPKKHKNKLILEFPAAHNISNGERDILCFLSMLMRAKQKLKKENCILLIDEVFDYLDDANVVSAQYYISQFIQNFKREKKFIFPIILTHLNPYYFKSYCFKKPAIIFLEKTSSQKDRTIHDIIASRSNELIKNDIDRYFLHYHPGNKDLKTQFNTLSLCNAFSTSYLFQQHVTNELNKYLNDEDGDPISICCAVRITLEQIVYEKLDEDKKEIFINTHKTIEKFIYAESTGVRVPELFYLLGVIYNEALHIKKEYDNFTPLISKLNNKTIKHMIKQAIEINHPE
jgi:hypothetical protein